MIKLLLLVVTLTTVVQSCPNVCNCIGDTISCSHRNLNVFPRFAVSDFNNVKVLDLSYNNFSSFPSNGFPNADNVETLLLNNNRIRSIANDSFGALVNDIKNLDLSNNQLASLPQALSKLENLKMLNVSNNYIGTTAIGLSEDVLKALGDTLTEFVFGSKYQREWPTSLSNHLQDLHRLEVTALHPSLTTLPPEAFHSFRTTLVELSIHNTNLLVVPLAISGLRNLETLNFDYNKNTGDQGMLVQSFPTMIGSKLHTLSLKGDSLTVFPRVLRYLRHLVRFIIDDNPLDFLSETSVEELNTLRELSIRNCSLERIPAALSTIQNLQSIDISSNSIETIEKRDLEGFENIENLTLSNMPLRYISRDSLESLHSIKELIFNNTYLTEVPLAVNFTTTLVKLSIGENRLDCMCESMVWLLYDLVGCSPSNPYDYEVIGDCDTIHSTVEKYLRTYVQQCPGYKEMCKIPPYNYIG